MAGLARSFTVLIDRSMIGKCSPLEQMCRVAGRRRLLYFSHANSLSPNSSIIVKPLLKYFLITSFSFFFNGNRFFVGEVMDGNVVYILRFGM